MGIKQRLLKLERTEQIQVEAVPASTWCVVIFNATTHLPLTPVDPNAEILVLLPDNQRGDCGLLIAGSK